MCVLTASEQLPRRLVHCRAVLSPTVRGLCAHLKPVIRFGPERREHHVLVGGEFIAGVRLVAAGIKLHLYTREAGKKEKKKKNQTCYIRT